MRIKKVWANNFLEESVYRNVGVALECHTSLFHDCCWIVIVLIILSSSRWWSSQIVFLKSLFWHITKSIPCYVFWNKLFPTNCFVFKLIKCPVCLQMLQSHLLLLLGKFLPLSLAALELKCPKNSQDCLHSLSQLRATWSPSLNGDFVHISNGDALAGLHCSCDGSKGIINHFFKFLIAGRYTSGYFCRRASIFS